MNHLMETKNTQVSSYNFTDKLSTVVLSTKVRMGTENKEKFEQYFTELSTATFMASLFTPSKKGRLKILDAGAGAGILGASLIRQICSWDTLPKEITLVAVEIDKNLLQALTESLDLCGELCKQNGIKFVGQIISDNFIINSASKCKNSADTQEFDYAILNPPYKKINNDSEDKQILSEIGIEVTNQYAAFVALVKRLLLKNGELVAITPRSFCNGIYFLEFRKDLLNNAKLKHFHLFESRKKVFSGEDILQESVIYHVVMQKKRKNETVTLSFSEEQNFQEIETNLINYDQLILPNDPLMTIRILKNAEDEQIKHKVENLPCTLSDISLVISTGPIVDFREDKTTLFKDSTEDTVPLIYPEHLQKGLVNWPKDNFKKFNAILPTEANSRMLRPKGNYVLVKRMSSKEEPRRIVAAVYNCDLLSSPVIGFENKINYFHSNKAGFDIVIAKGLSLFLNSTLIDMYFRQFSGNTQVNATDLRNIKYPSISQLSLLGNSYSNQLPSQIEIDDLVEMICIQQAH